jgi:zinc protease
MNDSSQILLKEIHETTLPNGMKLLVRARRKSSLATLQVWYKVGSRNEPVGRTGLSHLLEHMMFKGTVRVDPEEFSRLIQREGGQTNAFTTKDVTAYYVLIDKARISLPLTLERDRMCNLRLRSRDFSPERKVVMEERRLRTETQPEGNLLEEVEALAYQSHPYRWPVIGWMEDIQGVSVADVLRYRRKHYAPSNTLILAIGDFDPLQMMERMANHFGEISPGRPAPQLEVVEPPQRAQRRVVLKRDAKVPFLVMAHHAPRIGHQDAPALELLACLLAKGRSARLHRRLVREEQLVLNVGADYSLLSLDPGLFTLSARILPGRSIRATEEEMVQELGRLGAGELGEDELRRAKRQLEARFVFLLDVLLHQAILLAEYEMCGGWRRLEEYLPGIRSVTKEDISKVVTRYLGEENRTVGWLVPAQGGTAA